MLKPLYFVTVQKMLSELLDAAVDEYRENPQRTVLEDDEEMKKK